MKWYLKALAQNAIAALPERLADPLYYTLQRHAGELRKPRFDMRFDAALAVADMMATHRDGVAGKRVLEIGTGRTVDMPCALFLMGAAEVVTVDITRLLRPELVEASVAYLRAHWGAYRPRFAEHTDPEALDARFDALCAAMPVQGNMSRVLSVMNVDYRAPADGARLPLDDRSIDLMVTFVVLQHVPPDPMRAILEEGRRLLRDDGCMIHTANTGDHFAHVDSSLSPLEFLRWSERQWMLIAGNRFMYQNRMRADDYYDVFRRAGLKIAHVDELVDERALRDLRNGLPLHADWAARAPERNAVIRFSALLEKS